MFIKYQEELATQGFTVIEQVFNEKAIQGLLAAIAAADNSSPLFRKTQDLFAIRRFLQAVPAIAPLIFTPALQQIVRALFGPDYFPVKSIYFDKPGTSNWFVAWHQDLTISADKKIPLSGYGPWTTKQDQYAVQPPQDILESIYTLRIHLDDTDEENGALKVIPGSHQQGIYRPNSLNFAETTVVSCRVKAGGIMIMKPLLMHASSRSSNGQNRRVIHIECSNRALAAPLEWAERGKDIISQSSI
ncbi:phytanoyl-CoA dioxygenase family protein [Chitinophaga sp. 30R24]|uniref:phytanoyl-CoA dioxygenase family protein n=1 Tax=Chitinophaga sp. 30R24 TaxID=3248838 RepID=UPI003B90F991